MNLQFFAGTKDSTLSTFYQVTSKEDAVKIIAEGKLMGKEFKQVYAWSEQPTLTQAEYSGARKLETVLSFDANVNTFDVDLTVAKDLQSTARISTRPGPISVTNIKEVGFKAEKKRWWKFWKR